MNRVSHIASTGGCAVAKFAPCRSGAVRCCIADLVAFSTTLTRGYKDYSRQVFRAVQVRAFGQGLTSLSGCRWRPLSYGQAPRTPAQVADLMWARGRPADQTSHLVPACVRSRNSGDSGTRRWWHFMPRTRKTNWAQRLRTPNKFEQVRGRDSFEHRHCKQRRGARYQGF